ncbi:2-phospho-L-lactate guanylyltransferase [Zhongshania sp. BJYM1]|uniref:2-phospho-L-lactate guanylyltransferase n=1 Tax=Zhongshania aquatica TaxID=2965069 RepID=UPI0022B316A9|nr:2-phospho-L-lactate guanylyltransferase [Marortus sp. BJYM1]
MWALLPLKDFVQAKQRLTGCLTVSERRGLFHAMVEDVLTVLAAHSGFERIVVVSDDPAAQLLAEHYRIDCWSERDLGLSGLNGVVSAALNKMAVLTANESHPVAAMVVHGDLPLLGEQELNVLTAKHQLLMKEHRSAVSIATDRHGLGSNILVCDPASVPALAYGRDSCAIHYQEAVAMNLPAQIISLPGIAQDIDTQEDLSRLLALSPNNAAQRTLAYLHQAGIAQRLRQLDNEAANTSAQAWSAV